MSTCPMIVAMTAVVMRVSFFTVVVRMVVIMGMVILTMNVVFVSMVMSFFFPTASHNPHGEEDEGNLNNGFK
jgi:hypothetical protein